MKRLISLLLITFILVSSFATVAYAETKYYDKTGRAGVTVWSSDYGLKYLFIDYVMHEAVSPGTTSTNFFYHENYGTWKDTYGPLLTWDVMVTNRYKEGSNVKLTIEDWKWEPKSLIVNPGTHVGGGTNSTDVYLSNTSKQVEATYSFYTDDATPNWSYTTVNLF
ncbi:hypothetical protein Tfer_3295 [Thermincola ferriacetica]|uniref:Uncharacterized protein n=1 Tax=Thermincola ferriacetica TaxID=281456 RepID=A0A0L6VY36_9FIRM|nr:hypothetical protein [Thermincola ferriacetica]KNZ68170.1 hypothetical protein Tfer_3295 [Thermincola ferriacetica]